MEVAFNVRFADDVVILDVVADSTKKMKRMLEILSETTESPKFEY